MVLTTPLLSTVNEDPDAVDVKQPQVKNEEILEYTKSTHDEDDPKLITIRGSSTEYLEARRDLGKIIRRSSLQQGYLVVNGTKFKAKNLQNKIYSTEVDIEIIDQKGAKGQCKLTIYKDNKKKIGKKDQTIMISKKARHDSKYVKIVSKNIVQYILKGIIKKQIKKKTLQMNL